MTGESFQDPGESLQDSGESLQKESGRISRRELLRIGRDVLFIMAMAVVSTGCDKEINAGEQLLTEPVVPTVVSPEASPTSLPPEVAEVIAPTVTPESAVGFIPPNNPPEYDAEFFGGGRIIPEDNEGLNELLQAGRYRSLYLMASDMGVSLDLSSLEALQKDLDNFEARGDIESVQVWNGDELAPTVLSVVERTNGDGSKTFPWLGDPENNLLSARPDLAPVEDYLIGDVTIQPGYDFQWVYNEADKNFYTYMIDGDGQPAAWFDATRGWIDEDNQVVDGWYFVEIGFDGIGVPQMDMKVVFNGSELVVLDKDGVELGTVGELAEKNKYQKWEGDTSVVENLNKDEYTGEIVNSSGEIVGFKFNYEGVEYGVVIPSDDSVTGVSVGFSENDEFRVTGIEAGERAVIYDFEHELYLPMAKDLGDLYTTTVEIDKRIEQKRAENGEPGDEVFDWSVKGSYKHNTGLYTGISDSYGTVKMKKLNLGIVDYMTVHTEEGGHFEIVEFGYQDKDGVHHDNFYALLGGDYEGVSLFTTEIDGDSFKTNHPKGSFLAMNLAYRMSINSTASGLWPIWYVFRDILKEQGLSDAEMEDFVNGLDYRAGIEPPEGLFIIIKVFPPQ